eukprot:6506185-Lingulodinium_polyedra.AAC.1
MMNLKTPAGTWHTSCSESLGRGPRVTFAGTRLGLQPPRRSLARTRAQTHPAPLAPARSHPGRG